MIPMSANPQESTARLVLRAQLGDRSALDALLRRTQTWLYAYLRRVLSDDHLAADVLQDVFVLLYRKLAYLHEPRVYRTWVYRIASREAFRRLRKRSHDRRLFRQELPHESAGKALAPVDPDLDLDQIERLRAEITRIPPNTRAVLVLHYFEGCTLREAADVLAIPEGTAKSRLHYGLALLRERHKENRP